MLCRLERHINGQTPYYENEHRILCKNGTYKWILDRGKVVSWTASHKPRRVIGTHTDIHDRKNAEALMLKSNVLLTSMINQAPFAIHILEGDFNNISVVIENAESARIMGEVVGGRKGIDAAKQQTLRTRFFSIDGKHEIPLSQMPGPRALRGETSVNEEFIFLHANGTRIMVEASASPIFDQNHQIIAAAVVFQDITERKQSERALRENEKKFRSLVDQAAEMLFLHDLKGNLVDVNPAAIANTGFSREELSKMSVFDIDPDAHDRNDMRNYWESLKLEDPPVIFEVCHRRKDGSIYPAEIVASKIVLQDKHYILGLARDITERVAADEARQKNEQKHRHILKTAMDGFCVVDLTGRLIEVNEAYCQMSGYSEDELLSMSVWNLIANENEKDVAVRLEKLMQGGENRFESVHRRKDGTTYDVEVSAQCSAMDDGEFIAFIRDISERKEAEKAARELTERFQKVFNSQLDAIFVLDSEVPARIIECNAASVEVFGYKPDELKGETIEKLHVNVLGQKEFRKRLFEAITREGHMSHFEFSMKRKDGTVFPSEHSVFELKNDSGKRKGWVSIIRDLTERKELEASLRQAQKMESIGTLAGGIAHDFNNLLTPIIGMSELLLSDLPNDSLERQNAEEILKAGKRGRDLVKQILTFSRQSEHKLIPTHIQLVIKEMLKLIRSTIPSYVEIHQNIQPDCGMVMADPTQIHQVAMNIVMNAYHAVEERGGTISVSLKEFVCKAQDSSGIDLEPGQYAVLSISDNGHGMSSDLMDKIFEPYFTTKEKGKGTGLGLAVAYGIIREHKGTIKVDSELGEGTTFKVYLPLMKKTESAKPIGTIRKIDGRR